MKWSMPQSSARDPNAVPSKPSNGRARSSLGVVTYCFETGKKAHGQVSGIPNWNDPFTFIAECQALGAGSVQIAFGVLEEDAGRKIRDFAEAHGMRLESTVSLPQNEAGLAKLEAEFRTLRELGVKIARTVILPGRRYEQFKSMDELRAALKLGREALIRAEPLARKHDVRLAIENHKDQRTEERLKLLEELGGEWIRACLDVGNNLALLEDPLATARAFAPWTSTVHFKDQAVQECSDGFLLADVPLGAGCIDLPQVIQIVREKNPKALFNLELITRDALLVPSLREDYWATLSEMPAAQLSGLMRQLKQSGARDPLPVVSKLSLAERVSAERRNIEQSFNYATQTLGLTA